jgi:MFS family permease
MADIERRVIGKVMWRLIPFLIVCYFVAYLDRVNVGFATLHMNQALGLSEAAFGLGAGLFFVGYFLFEVPSNIFLEKVGARVWIARIMITWGIVSAAFAFIPSISAVTGIPTTGVFYSLRLLLGACEAGFFPGIIFYLSLWFPMVYRARVISLFMLAIPISSIIGSPISGMLLGLTGGGLDGWQWLFILEALPSVLVGIGVLIYLTDFPHQARWLQPDEVAWLENVQATEKRNKEKVEHLSLGQALTDPLNWSRLSEQKFRVDKWSLCRGLGRRAERRKIEVGLIRGAVVKTRMWSSSVVKVEIPTNRASRLADGFVGSQIDLLVFDAAPQPFDEHIVAPGSFAVHADGDAVVGKQAGEGRAGELRALVGVEYFRPAVASQGIFQSLDAEGRLHRDRQPPR